MNDDPSPDDIERDIEGERVALARALEDLQRRLSPDAMATQALGLLRSNSGDMIGEIVRQARKNPLAFAVTGAGLAWLIAGPVARSTSPKPGRVRGSDADESVVSRVAQAEADKSDPAARADAAKLSDTEAQTAPDDCNLRDRLMEGTEMMTDAARDRVIAAREAAISAERRLEAQAREYGSAGKDAFESRPLVGALVAFGVGALAGALLPRTRVEDEHLSGARDRALREAESVYRAEADKLRARADSMAADTRSEASVTPRDRGKPKRGRADRDAGKGPTMN